MSALFTCQGLTNFIDVLPNPLTVIAFFAAIICGIFAFMPAANLSAIYPVLLLMVVGFLSCREIKLKIENPQKELGHLEIFGFGLALIGAALLTLIIVVSHFWFPRIASGLGAIISFFIYCSYDPPYRERKLFHQHVP